MAEEKHDAELEQERAAENLAEAELVAELDEVNENITTLEAEKKNLKPSACGEAQWDKYSLSGERWQRSMHVNFLLGIFRSSKWRGSDIMRAAKRAGLFEECWECDDCQIQLHEELEEMGALIEGVHYNARMAIHFRLFCHMSIAAMELCNNLACMDYDRETDGYKRRVLRDMGMGRLIYVPRFIPARYRWEPEYLEYSAKLNLATDDEDGRLCWVPDRNRILGSLQKRLAPS